ncbi:MAG: stage II sporulation protein R [Oscillospiraceae bacterium]|jgi:stage II sporulation protein R|nr:stage II sporulation protein R [Oscillospiraceae bacterium]
MRLLFTEDGGSRWVGLSRRALTVGAVAAALWMLGGWIAEPYESAASRAALIVAASGDNLIRLHVIANSDSQADQALKLRVRDAVLAEYGSALAASDPRTARETIIASLEGVEACAAAAADELNRVPVSATFAREYFPDREYGGMVVPAGTYDSLIIRIGEAKGRNWWCVIYPPLCLLTPDTIAAAEAARPVKPAGRALAAPRSIPGLPDSVSDLYKGGRLIPASMAAAEPKPEPVFESVILRWIRTLTTHI